MKLQILTAYNFCCDLISFQVVYKYEMIIKNDKKKYKNRRIITTVVP